MKTHKCCLPGCGRQTITNKPDPRCFHEPSAYIEMREEVVVTGSRYSPKVELKSYNPRRRDE